MNWRKLLYLQPPRATRPPTSVEQDYDVPTALNLPGQGWVDYTKARADTPPIVHLGSDAPRR